MAHFAKLNSNNIVEQIICVNNDVITDVNGIEQEQLGVDFLRTLYNKPNVNWKQTSINTVKGVHSLGKTPLRKNYAGIDYIYDENRDAFIRPKPFNSWILNENTCDWDAPVPHPNDGNKYSWNENNQSWDVISL